MIQDNNYVNWNKYHNQYWPADYFIDTRGHVRFFHYGEGGYAEAEQVIQKLLAEKGTVTNKLVSKPMYDIDANTPETYLGYDRGSGFASGPAPVKDKFASYDREHMIANGEWTISGKWKISKEFIEPEKSGTLEFAFNARNVFLVIVPVEQNAAIRVFVDDTVSANTPDVKNGILTVNGSRLYQLAGLDKMGTHILKLEIQGKMRLFAFTFG